MTIADFSRVEAFPPGEYLADELQARGWTVAQFAEVLGRPVQAVSEIINGRKEITTETAVEIGAALGTGPEVWLRLQDAYRLWTLGHDETLQARAASVQLRSRLASAVPIRELVRRGIISDSSPTKQQDEVCALLGVRSLDEPPAFAAAARRTRADEGLSPTQVAWLACARRALGRVKPSRFTPSGLRSLAASVARSIQGPEDLVSLPGRFAEVGVGLVHVEPFPGGAIDGAAFNERGMRGIAISGRIARLDAVLFTLLHEAAHLHLGHPGLHVDEVLGDPSDQADELAADELARHWLLPEPLPQDSPVSRAFVLALAQDAGVHPSVIVGRLQHDGRLPWSHLRNLTPNARSALATWPSI